MDNATINHAPPIWLIRDPSQDEGPGRPYYVEVVDPNELRAVVDDVAERNKGEYIDIYRLDGCVRRPKEDVSPLILPPGVANDG